MKLGTNHQHPQLLGSLKGISPKDLKIQYTSPSSCNYIFPSSLIIKITCKLIMAITMWSLMPDTVALILRLY